MSKEFGFRKQALFIVLFSLRCVSLAQTEPSGGIEGRLVDADTGRAIAGARVQLSGGRMTAPILFRSGAEGEFRFQDLVPGTYRWQAEEPSYLSWIATQEIKAGVLANLGNIALTAKRSISGTVSWRDGSPAIGAVVHAIKVISGKATPNFGEIRPLVVDARGRFRLSEMSPGKYVVYSFVPPRGTNAGDERISLPQFYPQDRIPNVSSAVDLISSSESRPLVIVLDAVTGSSVSGVVQPSEGFAPGTSLVLSLVIPNLPVLPPLQISAKVGSPFIFPNVPQGAYSLVGIYTSGSKVAAQTALDLIVPSAGLSDVRMIMSAPSRLEGFVSMEDAEQGTSSPSVADIRLRATIDKYANMGTGGNPDAAGRFEFTGAFRSEWYSLVFPALPPDVHVASVTQGGNELTGGPLRVMSKEDAGDIRIILRRSKDTISGATIGERLSRGIVVLAPKARDAAYWFRTAVPKSDGTFSLTGAAPGEYDLFAFDGIGEGDYLDPALLSRYASQAVSVTVAPGRSSSFDLRIIAAR